MSEKVVVLLSGGLDSATTLALALADGLECHCISFAYGQKHSSEVRFAAALSTQLGAASHRVVNIDIGQFGGSALTDSTIDVPVNIPGGENVSGADSAIPVTYVPARNTIFLSYALGYAEVIEAREIYIGVNAVDYSGYPDCRPEFIRAFENMANLATKNGVEGKSIKIQTPLIDLPKSKIIALGLSLGIDYSATVSCYRLNDDGMACGACDSCVIRREGFRVAGIADPTSYV